MFDWLFPSFFMQNTSAVKKQQQHKLPIRVLDFQQLDDLYSLSHPFLTCPETITHLRATRVMFLMRGLPGSGKSTIVNILKRIYSKSMIVCSADNYFMTPEGVYNFNRDKIVEAHRVCQQQAEDACRNGILAVIIDNTNIRMDECKPYFQKASNYGYVVIVVEPRTSWKRDADTLIDRNTHQVPRDVIEGRLRQYHPLIPFYFGLFLNHEQSNNVLQLAFDCYQQALQNFSQLKRELQQISRDKNVSVHQLLHRGNMNPAPKILHCTVKFIGKMTDQSRKDYFNYAGNRMISHLLGKMCRGYVVGFVITPRTLSARLLFPDRHTWAVWAQDDYEVSSKRPATTTTQASGDTKSKHRPNRRDSKSKRKTTTDDTGTTDDYDGSMVRSLADDSDTLLVDRILTSDESEEVSFLHPTFGFFSRAHLTCGTAPEVKAAQAGLDMAEMIEKESDSLRRHVTLLESSDQQTVMKYFGNGCCIVYLREPLPIETIFSGFFH